MGTDSQQRREVQCDSQAVFLLLFRPLLREGAPRRARPVVSAGGTFCESLSSLGTMSTWHPRDFKNSFSRSFRAKCVDLIPSRGVSSLGGGAGL